MAFQTLGDLMQKKVLTRPGVGKSIQSSMLVDAIQKLLGEQFPRLAAHARVVWYKDGELALAPQSGSAAAEIRLRSAHMLYTVRQKMPQVTLVRIRTVLPRSDYEAV